MQLHGSEEDPRYYGLAELLIYHAYKPKYQERERIITFDDEKIKMAAEFAEKKKWPLILHIETAAAGNLGRIYIDQLEKFLDEHPKLPVIMIHIAELDSKEVMRLIQAHANIYFMTGHIRLLSTTAEKEENDSQPWTPMFLDGNLLDEWRALFISYPDRFIYASDAMIVQQWRNRFVNRLLIWQRTFQELPPEVAHKIAHKNAERLWHLEPPEGAN